MKNKDVKTAYQTIDDMLNNLEAVLSSADCHRSPEDGCNHCEAQYAHGIISSDWARIKSYLQTNYHEQL